MLDIKSSGHPKKAPVILSILNRIFAFALGLRLTRHNPAQGLVLKGILSPLPKVKSFNQCFTTPEALQAEKTMIQQAIDLGTSKSFVPLKFANSFEEGLKKAEKRLGFLLEDEQIYATKLATDNHQLVLIAGTAGTGKSTTFLAAKYIDAERGQSIVGTSVSKKAADALAESAEISTFTVDMLTTQYKNGINHLRHHASLIVDEASLLTISQLNLL